MNLKLNVAAALVFAALVNPVRAADFGSDTIPGKWMNPLLPEPLPPLQYPGFFNAFDQFKEQVNTGRYKLALQTARSLTLKEKGFDPAVFAVNKAVALSAIGQDDEAVAVLNDPVVADQEIVQLKKAELLSGQGKAADAVSLLKEMLGKHPNSLRGHYLLGQAYEQLDDDQNAKTAYSWFVAEKQNFIDRWRQQGERIFKSSAEDCTTAGLALDRWATLSSAYQNDSELNQTILDFFVKSYDLLDHRYWPAHLAAAEFYLARDDAENAKQECKAAMRINPTAAEAPNFYGEIAAAESAFDPCDQVIANMRRENPTSRQADLLEVRNLLAARHPKEAAVIAQKVIDRQPNNLEARGLLAATEALQLHDEKTKQLLAEVDRISPTDARAYLEVAEQLGTMRQYPRAAAMYQVAINRAPWWSAPRNGLGLLYTQSGEEDKARETLSAAHAIDPFDVSTTNYLRLLDDLAKFDKKESAHFIVVYDAQNDPLIGEYFNDYMESVYAEVTGEYKTEPPVKTIIEVFPTHDAFSVRTSGAPWLPTVGASTGRIIALVTPRRGDNTWKAYNWAQVLRHEFTHTVTLAATDNRISHWMTEGLAVYEERSGLQWDWVPMLYNAVTHEELFNLEELTWKFWRGKKPNDRQMAYAESYWICTYIEQKYGHDAILKMLADFKTGGLQQDVFPAVLGRTQDEFFADFTAWTKKQIATWGYDAETSKKVDQLEEHAEQCIADKDYPQAAALYEQVLQLRPMDQTPHKKLAGLYLSPQVKQPEKAIAQLKILHLLDVRDDRYAKRIARLYRDLGDYKNAQAWGMQAVYVDPYDMDAHELLRQICEKSGDQKALDREVRVIPELKAWQEGQETK